MVKLATAATTSVGVGWSSDQEGYRAGCQAAQQARQALGVDRIDLAFLFASPRLTPDRLLKGIQETLGHVPLIGGTDAGEICPAGPLQRSAVLLLVTSEDMHFALGAAQQLSAAPRTAGYAMANQCARTEAKSQRRACLLLADGLTGAQQELILGVQDVLGYSFPLVGCLVGDDLLFRRTYQFFHEEVLSDSVVGVLIAGDVRLAVSARHGWTAVGQPHRVTRAAHNILYALDGAPAARVYEQYMGQEELVRMRGHLWSQAMIAYPLGMSVTGEEELLLRNVVHVGQDGSLTCAGDIHEGSFMWLMVGTRESAMDAARLAARHVRESLQHLAWALVFDSVARRRLFGRHADQELAAIRSELGAQTPLIGCYTYGEQAPLRAAVHRGRSYLHNETALVIGLGA